MGEKVLMKGNEAIGGGNSFGLSSLFRLSYNTADGTFGIYGKENAENKRSISSSGK